MKMKNSPRVLLIGQPKPPQDFRFKACGYQFIQAVQGGEFEDLTQGEMYRASLIFYDWADTPRGSAFLRKTWNWPEPHCPVIIIDVPDNYSAIKMLYQGADTALINPVPTDLLLATLQAAIRRYNWEKLERVLTCGPLVLNQREHTASIHQNNNVYPLNLTGREFNFLEILMARHGNPVTKDGIFNYIYQGAHYPDIKMLDVLACKVRKKLSPYGLKNTLKTVRGIGFSINMELADG